MSGYTTVDMSLGPLALDGTFLGSRTAVTDQVQTVLCQSHGVRWIVPRAGKRAATRIELACPRSRRISALRPLKRNNSLRWGCACPARIVLVQSKSQPNEWRVRVYVETHQHLLPKVFAAGKLSDPYALVWHWGFNLF